MGIFAGTQWDRPPRCERCEEVEEECVCEPEAPPRLPPEKQTAKLRGEKRKRGKEVTVVRGLDEKDNDLPELLSRLKTACGAGGTIKDGALEIQGSHLARIEATLKEIGYRVRQ